MAIFDAELWHSRAWSRYQNALGVGADRSEAIIHWDRDVIHVNALAILIDWCTERSIKVKFCKREAGIYYPCDKCIKINGRLQPEKQVFFLLHECGHHLVGDKEKNERFGMGYSQDDPSLKRTFHHRCDIVDEELEAWYRGFKLAKRLHLRINKERFDLTRIEMLKSYFAWALRVNGYGGSDAADED